MAIPINTKLLLWYNAFVVGMHAMRVVAADQCNHLWTTTGVGSRLVQLDRKTGNVMRDIGITDGPIKALEFSPVDGVMYAMKQLESGYGQLGTLNMETGGFVPIMDGIATGIFRARGLAASGDGSLYTYSPRDEYLYELDTTMGTGKTTRSIVLYQ